MLPASGSTGRSQDRNRRSGACVPLPTAFGTSPIRCDVVRIRQPYRLLGGDRLWVHIARNHPGLRPRQQFPKASEPALSSWHVSPGATRISPQAHNREVKMSDLLEITERERLSREDAAARLHAIADALAKHNDVEFDRGGLHFKVHVPDEVDFKLEIEFEDDERELEIELKW